MRRTVQERGCALPLASAVPTRLAQTLMGPRARWARDLIVGAGAPSAVAALIAQAPDWAPFRPGAILLAVVIATAAAIGVRAALVSTVTSCALVAAMFTTRDSEHGWVAVVSLVVFVAAAVGVLVLVGRIERARRNAELERRVTNALIEAAPVGIAMFGPDLRLQQLNRRLAGVDGRSPAAMVGRRLGALGPRLDLLLAAGVAEVRSSGRPVDAREHTTSGPDRSSPDRHWTASYFPVVDGAGEQVGVGAVVQDVTNDVVTRGRAARLTALAADMTRVLDVDDLVRLLTGFLADALGGRALVAVVDTRRSALQVHETMRGYTREEAEAWRQFDLPIEREVPMCEAARAAEPIVVEDPVQFEQQFPGLEPQRRLVGDAACICVPILDPTDHAPLAVFRVGWPTKRPIDQATRTLCDTVASLAALALNRVRLTEWLSQDRFRAALDSMLDSVTIAESVRDAEERIVDFRVDFVNDASRRKTADLASGRRLLDQRPDWGRDGTFDRLVEVVDTGVPWVDERLERSETRPDGTATSRVQSLRVVRFGDGYLAASRDVTRMVRLEREAAAAQALADRERMAVELLQQAALPIELPARTGLTIGALYQPAVPEQPIGGDWYDVFLRRDGRMALVIADVSGHGPRSAAFMVKVRNVVRAVATQVDAPAEVLGVVNRVLCDHYAEASTHFVTCTYALVDADAAEMEWAAAAHPPPVVVTDGRARLLAQRPGLPLAVTDTAEYRTQSVTLRPGDRIALYTDGLFERRGETVDDGLARLAGSLESVDRLGAEAAVARLGASVSDPFDDLAALVVDLLRDGSNQGSADARTTRGTTT